MVALMYLRGGLSVIPIVRGGSKSPAIASWKRYQQRPPDESELYPWFDNARYGIAILGGAVSGWLEIFDCDAPELFDLWCELVESVCPGLLARLVIVRTPSGGWHVYYRCKAVEGNLKLARRAIEVTEGTDGAKFENGRWIIIKTLLETRGEGGYVLAPGSPPECHVLRMPYVLMRGELMNIPTTTPEERNVILDAARSLNEYVRPESTYKPTSTLINLDGYRPGDDFNARADWFELLTRHGWKLCFTFNNTTYWKRPGKEDKGWSATTNYGGSNLLYVFSTNGWPFEDQMAYSLFGAYALLEHGGNFRSAAKALARQGYGTAKKKQKAIISLGLKPACRPKNPVLLSPPKRPENTILLSTPSRPATTILLNSEVAR